MIALALLPAIGHAGFFIQNGQLLDDNGTPFVMRGVNYPYTWFQSRNTQADLAAIAATGSNTVRIVLSTGGQWARVNGTQVAQLIQWCKDLRMIAVLEVHDSTGWSEQASAVPISNATAYWLSSDIRAAINGQENFVIINIANEPFGNNTSANYTPDTVTAIQALRSAGLTHNIMIDAANWGQDWSNTMRTNAMQLWNADTLRNLTFSVHMYEVYQSLSTVQHLHAGLRRHEPAAGRRRVRPGQQRAVRRLRVRHRAGTCPRQRLPRLVLVGQRRRRHRPRHDGNFDPAQLTTWGNRIVNGTNGIRATSVLATVFGTTNNLAVGTTSLSFASGASSSPVGVTANVSWTVTDNQTWIAVSPTSGSSNGSFTISATANTGTTSRTGTVTVTGGGLTRTVAVTQAAPSSSNLTVAPTAVSLASAASSATFTITSNVGWTVTDNQSWLTVAVASGSNNATVAINATANTAASSRGATVTVTGGGITRTVAVTQAGTTASTLTVSASTLALAAAASSGSVSITSNVSWTVTDDQSWLTASPSSGTGNATLTLSATANTASAARTGTVTVTGGGITRTLAVTQSASSGTGETCANPVTFSGNSGNFNTAGAVCYRTNVNINGWGCYNFDGRTLTVSGVARTCGQTPVTRAADGYYYFSASAGQFPWAGLYTW